MNIDEAIEIGKQGKTEGLKGMYPMAAQVLADEVIKLRKDAKRIDWLADVNNRIGNVQLPIECIENNPDSLRAAIDMAMGM